MDERESRVFLPKAAYGFNLRAVSPGEKKRKNGAISKLDDARAIIDECDLIIVEALSRRFEAVARVLEYKIANELPAFDPEFHQHVVKRASERMEFLGGDGENARQIFSQIAGHCMEIQAEKIRQHHANDKFSKETQCSNDGAGNNCAVKDFNFQ